MSTIDPKKKDKSIPEKLREQRIAYEGERNAKERKHRAIIDDIKARIDKVNATDYAAPYIERYKASLQTLETLYAEMQKVHADTQGLSFRVGDYIQTCKCRSIQNGQVEQVFKNLVQEGRRAIEAVKASRSVDADIEPLRHFCQCLVDLRFICQHAIRLIDDSKLADQDRQRDLAPLKQKLDTATNAQKHALTLENMDCYASMSALRQEILDENAKMANDILGAGNPGFDGSYRFLVGFAKAKLSREDLEFGTRVLKLPADSFSRTPIYFHYTTERSCILVKAPSSYLETNEFNDFIRNLYFTFAAHLPPRNLLFGGVECDPFEAVVGGLGERIKQLGDTYVCHEVEDRGNKLTDNTGTLTRLRELALENSRKQKGESIHDIFEYNELFADNPQKFAFFCVNNYPAGFNGVSGSVVQDLRQLALGGSKGMITIICETTDGEYRDSAPMLTAEELHADLVEFDKDGNMTYNGAPADARITSDGFKPRDYWNQLDKYFKSAGSIMLDKLLESVDRSNIEPKPKTISIPIGKSDGNLFSLDIESCTDQMFGLVIGTTGSGKSAFLHTLILSAAYNNSPEDLQLYLADFKDGSGSTEFSHYRKREGVNNLYIPHVRYLLLKGKSESAFDLLEKIQSIRSERAAILSRAGYSQITDYNNSDAVLSGREKKLPNIIFIIDEYNAMLNGGGDADRQSSAEVASAIAAKIKNLITTARAYGIGILLCGQSVDSALKTAQGLGNMGCRISLPVKNDSDLISLFDLDSYDARKRIQQLAGQGDALMSLGRTANLRYVRTAYSGKTNGAQQLKIADMIRKKYAHLEYTQVEAGSEVAVPIIEAENNGMVTRPTAGNEFVLEMGVSSASALRIPLVYSTAEAAVNYYACTNKEKLCRIEQNAMFAYLRYAADHHLKGDSATVTYLAMNEKMSECLDPYFAALPWLKSRIHTVTNKADIAKKLMELRRIYRERKRAVDRGESSHFDPLFIVLRDVAWLNDKDADWLPNTKNDRNAAKPAPAPAEPVDTSKISAAGQSDLDKLKKLGMNLDPSLMAGILKNAANPSAAAPKPEEVAAPAERFTLDDVKNALATLYADGNKYSMFLLASSETYQPIKNLLLSASDINGAAITKYGIFGSFDEVKTHTADFSAPAECIFVPYFNSKICLYDYSPSAYSGWWSQLKNDL